MSKLTSMYTVLIAALLAVGCASAPQTVADQNDIRRDADETLAAMIQVDPSLRTLVDRAPGYVVFPEVSEAAMIAGGATGVGVVYQDGSPIGYATLNEGSFGAQVGGQVYSELVIFETHAALDRLRNGNFDMSADASATMLQSGAAVSARFENGTAVFITRESGAMVEASIGGQVLEFEPMS